MKLLGLQVLAKPKVLHSCPGRIRFYLPFLKRLGKQHLEFVEIARKLLESPEGIKTVSVSHVRGSLLMEYDRTLLSEQEICDFVFSCYKAVVANRESLSQLAGLGPEEMLARLTRWFDGNLPKKHWLDTDRRLPIDDLG